MVQLQKYYRYGVQQSNGNNTLIILNHAKEHDLGKKSVKVLIFVISVFLALLNTRAIVPNIDHAKFCNVIYTMNMAAHRNILLQSRTNIKILLIPQTCWVSWPMNTTKPGRTVGPALKAVSNIQTNPINLYKTFVMANMQHKPCILSHQHCFIFPLLTFLKTLLKHPKHLSNGRFQ